MYSGGFTDQRVQYSRAYDVNGDSWPTRPVDVRCERCNNDQPFNMVDGVEFLGRPLLILSDNFDTIMITHAADADGNSWGPQILVEKASNNLNTPFWSLRHLSVQMVRDPQTGDDVPAIAYMSPLTFQMQFSLFYRQGSSSVFCLDASEVSSNGLIRVSSNCLGGQSVRNLRLLVGLIL